MRNVILIPKWMEGLLTTNNLTLADALDFNKVTTTLSDDDVGFYIFINMKNRMIQELSSAGMVTGLRALKLTEEMVSSYQRFINKYEVMEQTNQIRPHEAMFGPTLNPVPNESIGFTLYELGDDTIGLVPFSDVELAAEQDLYSDIIQIQSKYMDFSDLVKQRVFRVWLERKNKV